MVIKILKSTRKDFWYNKHIDTHINIDKFIPAHSPDNEKDVLVIYLSSLDEYGHRQRSRARYIYAEDTDYYKQIRKEKLKKLNEESNGYGL
jgi:hypothetical protein